MRAETSSDSVSIPVSRGHVKKAISSLLDGLPVEASEFNVTVSDTMTAGEFSVAFERLQRFERSVMVRVRFREGALWNSLHEPRFRSVRKAFMAELSARLTLSEVKRYLKRLSVCGWVAHKWPVETRDDKHCWTWYIENPQDDAKRGGVDALPYFLAVRRVSAEDGDWFECAGVGDKRIMVRIPSTLSEDGDDNPPEKP